MRALIAMGAVLALVACVAEFPAEAPEVPPTPDSELPEPEPDPEPESDGGEPEPEPEDMLPPEPDLGPQPEICNGADDDLDGVSDEDFALNQPCATPNGICGLTACADGGEAAECVAGDEMVAQGDEACNGLDDDCDGTVDEGFDVAAECTVGQGICETFGLRVCAADGASTACDAVAGEPEAVEFCGNGADDDCDGQTDEGDCE